MCYHDVTSPAVQLDKDTQVQNVLVQLVFAAQLSGQPGQLIGYAVRAITRPEHNDCLCFNTNINMYVHTGSSSLNNYVSIGQLKAMHKNIQENKTKQRTGNEYVMRNAYVILAKPCRQTRP